MKQTAKLTAVLTALALLISPAVFADVINSPAITVSAQVPSNLSLNVVLHQNTSVGAVLPSMDFGTLQPTASNNLVSSAAGSTGTGSVVALLSANTQGAPYVISQTGTALTRAGGAETLPAGALQVTPVYAAADNGGAAMPAGAVLGTQGSWVAAGKTLYDSENGSPAAIRVIQAHYAIIEGAGGTVPPNQAAGTYNGTVTFTVTY
jgi:spore coat protein U-like protein